jgi:hypothetical protein
MSESRFLTDFLTEGLSYPCFGFSDLHNYKLIHLHVQYTHSMWISVLFTRHTPVQHGLSAHFPDRAQAIYKTFSREEGHACRHLTTTLYEYARLCQKAGFSQTF